MDFLANFNDAQLLILAVFALCFLWKGAGMNENEEVRGALILTGCFFCLWVMGTVIGNKSQELHAQSKRKAEILFEKRGEDLTFRYQGDGKLVKSAEEELED